MFSAECLAAEPEVSVECRAEWADEERGIAKVTLTENGNNCTELSIGKTDYIFMIDGSRTTTLNDKYLLQENVNDLEPMSVHCPCMAEGHYYMVGGVKVFPLTYTLGYVCSTGDLKSWSSARQIWSDSAGAHFNGNGRRIPVRYASGCLDIFTIFKNEAVSSIRKIAQRNDGSRVAFIAFSGEADSLYGMLQYTSDYEKAIRSIREAGYIPASLLCPGLAKARALYDGGGRAESTKIFVMGDGRNNDMNEAVRQAAQFRSQPGVIFYSACMGKEACVQQAGYQAMYNMTGRRSDRFWRIQTRPSKDLAEAFAAAVNEKTEITVGTDQKTYGAAIPDGEWEYYENAAEGYVPRCSVGEFYCIRNRIVWSIPKNSLGNANCSFYLKLRETARYVAETKEYEVLDRPEFSYVIRGGSMDGTEKKVGAQCNTLPVKPSGLEVTKVQLVSGVYSQKAENVFYVKGSAENELTFSAHTDYASEKWKPEKLILHERFLYGGTSKVPESGLLRSPELKKLTGSYHVTLDTDKEIREYYPQASIGQGAAERYTKQFDEEKKLTLICDAKAPEITGAVPEIIRKDVRIPFSASDDGSGLKNGSFRLELTNQKTGETKVFTGSGSELSWNIRLDDAFYSGNIRWVLKVEDKVTNSRALEGISNIRVPKSEETIANEIRTRIL